MKKDKDGDKKKSKNRIIRKIEQRRKVRKTKLGLKRRKKKNLW